MTTATKTTMKFYLLAFCYTCLKVVRRFTTHEFCAHQKHVCLHEVCALVFGAVFTLVFFG
jgi:hypothetical protein